MGVAECVGESAGEAGVTAGYSTVAEGEKETRRWLFARAFSVVVADRIFGAMVAVRKRTVVEAFWALSFVGTGA